MAYCSNLLLCLCALLSFSVCSVMSRVESEFVKEVNTRLVINTSSIIATISDHFLCVTLETSDPYAKGNSFDALHLDLENPLLEKTLAGLSPVMVRIGGILQDLLVYDVGEQLSSEPCTPFVLDKSALFNFSGGCLSMERWDGLNQFFMKTGVSVAFGLNILYGRFRADSLLEVSGPWISSNTENLIRYTRDRGYPVTAWELGNELFGVSAGPRVPAALYASDVKKLRNIIDKLYQGYASKPKVVAPDMMNYGTKLTRKELPLFLRASGEGVTDVVTRHVYIKRPEDRDTNNDLMAKQLDPSLADDEIDNYESLQSLMKEFPKTSVWIGEAGCFPRGGRDGVTNVFNSAFWYLSQLGTASRYNNQAFCRQSFVGAFYGLVDNDFNPNPDYYGALLWRQLMGNGVFNVDIHGGNKEIRAYAHCQRNNQGGLTLLILNYSNSTSHHLDLNLLGHPGNSLLPETKWKDDKLHLLTSNEASSGNIRLEYHMSAPNRRMDSRVVLLNGEPLRLTPSGELPTLAPLKVNSTSPIIVEPLTYAYVVIPNANSPACVDTRASPA